MGNGDTNIRGDLNAQIGIGREGYGESTRFIRKVSSNHVQRWYDKSDRNAHA